MLRVAKKERDMPDDTKSTNATAASPDSSTQASTSSATGAQPDAAALGRKSSPAKASAPAVDIAAEVEKALAKAQSSWGRERATMEARHSQEIAELQDRLEYGDDVDKLAEIRARRAMASERALVEQERVEARKERLIAQGIPEALVADIDSISAADAVARVWLSVRDQITPREAPSPETDEVPPQEPHASPGGGALGPAVAETTKQSITAIADGDEPFDAKKAADILAELGVSR